MSLSAKASGKLFIAGEYSVLFGGKAIVAAINRFAIAEYKPGGNFSFLLRMNNDWQQEQNHPLWSATSEALKKHQLSPCLGNYRIDTSDFFTPNGTKLGLGSSAAATVALSKILLGQHGVYDLNLILKLAHEAHLLFSKNLGSGADIAASCYEKSIEFINNNKSPKIKFIDLSFFWPELIFINTKRAQDTREFVKKAYVYAQKNRAATELFQKRSNELLELLLKSEDQQSRILIFTSFFDLLKSFGDQSGIDIISKEHEAIYLLAKSLGGSAKPSGAGGGDFSMAIVPELNRQAFLKGLETRGYEVFSFSQL